MTFAILILTFLMELTIYRVHVYRTNAWVNSYRRSYVSIKTRHLVNMDRISTNRY